MFRVFTGKQNWLGISKMAGINNKHLLQLVCSAIWNWPLQHHYICKSEIVSWNFSGSLTGVVDVRSAQTGDCLSGFSSV